jgi:hypothetical protein
MEECLPLLRDNVAANFPASSVGPEGVIEVRALRWGDPHDLKVFSDFQVDCVLAADVVYMQYKNVLRALALTMRSLCEPSLLLPALRLQLENKAERQEQEEEEEVEGREGKTEEAEDVVSNEKTAPSPSPSSTPSPTPTPISTLPSQQAVVYMGYEDRCGLYDDVEFFDAVKHVQFKCTSRSLEEFADVPTDDYMLYTYTVDPTIPRPDFEELLHECVLYDEDCKKHGY